jgi:hypothetical protein
MKFGFVVANIPNLVANDYKSHVVVNGVVTFWLISTSASWSLFNACHENYKMEVSTILSNS